MSEHMHTGWQSNVKKVLRIAFIGLKPKQRVMIKGYLRNLMRMDFDMEWVSPKRESISFYIINHQFSNAESITSLLATNPAPVLYVDEREDLQNTIKDNTLYLKLVDLNVLEAWLSNHVAAIGSTLKQSNQVNQTTDIEKPESRLSSNQLQQQSRQESLLVESDRITSKHNVTAVQDRDHTQPVLHSDGAQITDASLQLIRLINEHEEDGFYEIHDADKFVAVIQPIKRLVWIKDKSETMRYSPEWRINKIAHYEARLADSVNLHQWLWHLAMKPESRSVCQLLSSSAKVSLKVWPKPTHDDKSSYLKLFSLIEIRPYSSQELATLLDSPINKIHQVLSALYVSGCLSTDNLDTPDQFAREQMNKQIIRPQKTATDSNDVKKMPYQAAEAGIGRESKLLSDGKNDTPLFTAKNNSEEPLFISKEEMKQRKAITAQKGLLARIRASLGF